LRCDHCVELFFAGVGEHSVADDACVVHQNVEAAEGVDGGRDEAFGLLPVGDVRATGDGFTTRGGDFVDNALRGTAAACRRTVKTDADVVDHDARPFGGEGQRVRASDTTTGPRHDDHTAVEQSHIRCLLAYLRSAVVVSR
jgi:hypothetical protein